MYTLKGYGPSRREADQLYPVCYVRHWRSDQRERERERLSSIQHGAALSVMVVCQKWWTQPGEGVGTGEAGPPGPGLSERPIE